MTERDASRRVQRYEGLVRATARRIVEYVELDLDDIEQRLRIKVWRGLATFNPLRSSQPEDRYVLSCVFNEKKDILALKRRGDIAFDAVIGDRTEESFEAHYLAVEATEYLLAEEDPLELPSTLTETEKQIILRLYVQRYQTEIALELGLSKGEMERAMRSIRAKLADWRPSAGERGHALEPPLRLPARRDRQAA